MSAYGRVTVLHHISAFICVFFVFSLYFCFFFFFFFQAEDGIRDWSVTGVQTCALPISNCLASSLRSRKSCIMSRGFSGRRSSLMGLKPWLVMIIVRVPS